MIIDGTTQAGFNGAPIVIIDGQNTISTAFNLGAGSDGSIIRGFQITGFTSDAIVVAASNATIGGGVGGQGNIIFGNSGDAIHVTAGAGNTFSQNLIYSNAGSIVLASNTNGNQVAPTITSVTSVPNLTTIDFDFTAAAAGNYTFEFFASGTGGEGPAKVFLGTKTLSLAAGANHRTVTLNLATPLVNQTVTATATSNATQNTSALAASQPLGNAFQVSNTNDSGTGSLRQAIINADATGSLVPITIDFTISTSTISLVTPLPAVTVPLVLAPSTVITLSGLSLPAGSSGFDLEAGSGGSVIRNFTISGFGGSAILVNSSNNTISGLTIDYVSGQSGVAVGSGLLLSLIHI